MSLTDAVSTTVDALKLDGVDAALVALLRRWAREVDAAAAVRAQADRTVADVLDDQGPDSALYERVTALRAKLGERECLDRLGARVLAALVELNATPRARSNGKAPAAAPTSTGALGKLRGLPSAAGET